MEKEIEKKAKRSLLYFAIVLVFIVINLIDGLTTKTLLTDRYMLFSLGAQVAGALFLLELYFDLKKILKNNQK